MMHKHTWFEENVTDRVPRRYRRKARRLARSPRVRAVAATVVPALLAGAIAALRLRRSGQTPA